MLHKLLFSTIHPEISNQNEFFLGTGSNRSLFIACLVTTSLPTSVPSFLSPKWPSSQHFQTHPSKLINTPISVNHLIRFSTYDEIWNEFFNCNGICLHLSAGHPLSKWLMSSSVIEFHRQMTSRIVCLTPFIGNEHTFLKNVMWGNVRL